MIPARAPRAVTRPAERAGDLAEKRAIALGYCRTTAGQLRRAAVADHRPDESPEQTAERIVAEPPAAAVNHLPQRVPA